jgi:hypothetical protein
MQFDVESIVNPMERSKYRGWVSTCKEYYLNLQNKLVALQSELTSMEN